MRNKTGSRLLRREIRQPNQTRRRPEWERPFVTDDPYWREWNQSKQRKEMY